MTEGALHGIKVLEYCQLVAGPYCAKLLADLGAEVIKVEAPGGGDEARRRAPFLNDIPHPERSGLFLYLNTNKLGITLDPATSVGKRLFEELVKQVDVLVEDSAPGRMKELGLDYEQLQRLNPRLIMTSITPFGQTGPYKDYKAYHLNVFHAGGEGYFTPRVTSFPDRPPLKVGKFVGDYRSGISGAVATLGALYWCGKTGLGQHIDVSKQQAEISLMAGSLFDYPAWGHVISRQTQAYGLGGVLRCKDGFVHLHIVAQREWRRLVEAMGNPAWAKEDRFQDWTTLAKVRPELDQRISEWALQHTKDELYHLGQAKGLAMAPYHTVADVMNWVQMKARGFFVEAEHPEVGRVKYPSVPYQLSRTPFRLDRPAPLLGQHNDEIRGRLARAGQARDGQAEGGGGNVVGLPIHGDGIGTDALEGIRVLDFGWAAAGPFATGQLAMMGAEVIKVETRKRLDVVRTMVDRKALPPYNVVDIGPLDFLSTYAVNKYGITLDVKHPEGLELAKRLVKISDVVAENFRSGVMERLGLGYPVLKELKPDIIMFSASGFGGGGPESHYAGYAPIFAALGGLGDMTGYADGPPSELGGSMDMISGLTGAVAILAALRHRQRTGEGQHVDMSQTEAIACLLGDSFLGYAMNNRVESRDGNRDDIMAPHNCYRCQGEDKWISIAVSTEEEWRAFCEVMGDPDWAKEERFGDGIRRWENQEELDRLLEDWTKGYTPYQLMEMLQRAGVAAVPSFTAEDLFTDPHLAERGFTEIVEHPVVGAVVAFTSPWKLSATPTRISRPAPMLGEHNWYVFGDLLGLSAEEITRLEEEKVLY